MNNRNYNGLDVLCLIADDALATLFGRPRTKGREDPAKDVEEAPLSSDDKQKSAKLMRVNHSGEICAQALYRGQALTARSRSVKSHMIKAAREENDHLQWCENRLNALDGQKSALNPAWYFGSFTTGALAGLLGDRPSLGFLAETEKQVETHLNKHLELLPKNDLPSHSVIMQMKDDEKRHATAAIESGALELPYIAKFMMRIMSSIMTSVSYRI
ncbi:MAG: demethoxyubiquinone hydroxylase family protein [Acidiferrobacteraceae bacterium]|nr:demethoxyubiquinone hydroxylase family protein [Acidiferrobacteraceae bacterium]|tara:strand:+ start:1005 stop:1649 length:645 start_codon:yes stop_codon:yes gene_type:complete